MLYLKFLLLMQQESFEIPQIVLMDGELSLDLNKCGLDPRRVAINRLVFWQEIADIQRGPWA